MRQLSGLKECGLKQIEARVRREKQAVQRAEWSDDAGIAEGAECGENSKGVRA